MKENSFFLLWDFSKSSLRGQKETQREIEGKHTQIFHHLFSYFIIVQGHCVFELKIKKVFIALRWELRALPELSSNWIIFTCLWNFRTLFIHCMIDKHSIFFFRFPFARTTFIGINRKWKQIVKLNVCWKNLSEL